jgi:pyruvate formate lyase activating enzyme
MNQGGSLYSLVYGKPCAAGIDPIEKKPLYHFLPATGIMSIATAGCLLSCKCCQNWHISQSWPEDTHNIDMPPKAVVEHALQNRCSSIAYTYNEPTVFFEYMMDTCRLAHEHHLRNVYVTCGYINQQPLKELCDVMDAANVDLKGFTDEFYIRISGGRLKPVLDAIITMKNKGVHVEITNLLIPTQNDTSKEIAAMARWIRDYVGKETPLHFSRFHPDYRLRNLPPTPVQTLERAREIAKEAGLEYVYVGNVPGNTYNSTFCPNCGNLVIHRVGYNVRTFQINPQTSQCQHCNHIIQGVWT